MGRSALSPSTPANVGEVSQRQRIVSAMIASCAEKSYARTTITDIVARARISRTTFYKRFDDKRSCFDATVDLCLGELRTVAAAGHSPGDAPPRVVRGATAAILEAMAARPDVTQLLAADAVSVDPFVVERYRGLAIPALENVWAGVAAPAGPRLDPQLAFGRAQLLVLNQIVAGRPERLLDLHPEIVYLAAAPFAGHRAALKQAEAVTGQGRSDGGRNP